MANAKAKRKSKKKNWRKVLCKAACEIEKRGWVKGEVLNYESGSVCAIGAINAAATGNPDEGSNKQIRRGAYEAAEIFARYLLDEGLVGDYFRGSHNPERIIPEFNDSLNTLDGASEVQAALRDCSQNYRRGSQ